MGRSYHVLEAILLATAIYLFFTRAYNPLRRRKTRKRLTETEIESRIRAWKPAPIAEETEDDTNTHEDTVLEAREGTSVMVEGKWVKDFVTNNFLGLAGDKRVAQACTKALERYGCGACGPRGFYGTVDVHLECESAIAKFSNTKDAILYSFGAATAPSIIPAFCQRGDVMIVDKGANFAIQSGVDLSRAKVLWFEHNDMNDLERQLESVVPPATKEDDTKRVTQRRFIITEAVSAYYGDVAPLDELVRLKTKYRFRLLLDESFSFGTLGETGRGALEEFGLEREQVDIATADLANAASTVGGYCVGEVGVVSHQRLSGAGYCFSASQPPFMAVAATKALEIIDSDGKELMKKLRRNIRAFRKNLDIESVNGAWYLDGGEKSPLMYIRCRTDKDAETFERVKELCLENGVFFGVPKYVENEKIMPRPSIRVAISAAHSEDEAIKAGQCLRDALLNVQT